MTGDSREAALAFAHAWNRGRRLRVYRAEAIAAHLHDVDLLDGTLEATQAYVDRITRSPWWQKAYDAPRDVQRRVIVRRGRQGGGFAFWDVRLYRGHQHPHIMLGTGTCTAPNRPAIADPWVILHELAHVLTATSERGHGREFARAFAQLVARWLGADAARVLREGYATEGVKYRARPSKS